MPEVVIDNEKMKFLIKLFICLHVVLIGSGESLTMKKTLKLFWPFSGKESPANTKTSNNTNNSEGNTEEQVLETNPAQAEALAEPTPSDPNDVVVIGLAVTVTDEDDKLSEKASDPEEDPALVGAEEIDGYEKEQYPQMPENPTDPLATHFFEKSYDDGTANEAWSNISTSIGLRNFGEDAIYRITESCQKLSLYPEVKKVISQDRHRKKKSPHGRSAKEIVIKAKLDLLWDEMLSQLQKITSQNNIDEAIFLGGILIALKLMKLHEQIVAFKNCGAQHSISKEIKKDFITKITLIVHRFLNSFFQSFIKKNQDLLNYLEKIGWQSFLEKIKISQDILLALQSCKNFMDDEFDLVVDDSELPLELQIDRATGYALSTLNGNVQHLNSIFVKHGT